VLLSGIGPPLNQKQRERVLEQYQDSNRWLSEHFFDGVDPFPNGNSTSSDKSRKD